MKRASIIRVRNCRMGPAKRPGLFCPSVPGNFLKCRNKMVPLFGSLCYALAGKRIKEILVAKHRHALAVLQIQRGLQAPHQNVLAALPLVLAAACPGILSGKGFSEGHADDQIHRISLDHVLIGAAHLHEIVTAVLQSKVDLGAYVINIAVHSAPQVHIGILGMKDPVHIAPRADAEDPQKNMQNKQGTCDRRWSDF